MAQPQDEKLPELRPEAAPLPFAELTDEQRSAGEKAAKLLRSMARSPGDALPKPSQKHSYLPPIDLSRTNRVILLDGARGSGKSALLVTLIDAYSRALKGEGVPAGYESWIRPEDRIVPVGLIDLQPLPDSTHLMLHLLSCLEHVVKALEPQQETNEAEGAAWHPGHGQERASRRLWRQLVRAVTLGWKSGLSKREGSLDPDALTVEAEEGELLRLDVGTAFRRFVDALVQDVQQWNHWSKGNNPLFLLSVDDADMNPKFCWELLELLRKLWHPRLAFLLTGETQLFLERPLDSEESREQLTGALLQAAGRSEKDATSNQSAELKAAIYAKIIPRGHRCELRPLSPEQRLVTGPMLGEKILLRAPIPGSPGKRTLADIFNENNQIQEALPERLRQLHDLADLLSTNATHEQDLPTTLSAPQIVEKIWHWVLENSTPTKGLGESLITFSKGGTIHINAQRIIVPDFSNTQSVSISSNKTLFIGQLERFKPSSASQIQDTRSSRARIAALMLAIDYAAETSDATAIDQTSVTIEPHTHFYAFVSSWQQDHTSYTCWPAPNWKSFGTFKRLAVIWRRITSQLPMKLANIARLASQYLNAVIDADLAEDSDFNPTEAPLNWQAIARRIGTVVKRNPDRNKSQAALAEWCLGSAGLLAAPESGLPADEANAFLLALEDALGPDWDKAKRLLRVNRIKRIRVEAGEGMSHAPSEKEVLKGEDRASPKHIFASIIEEPSPQEIEEQAKRIRYRLEDISSQWLREMRPGDDHKRGLAFYASSARASWMAASSKIANTISETAEGFRKTVGFPEKAIENLWLTTTRLLERHDLSDVIRAPRGELTIRPTLRDAAVAAASRGLKESTPSYNVQRHKGIIIEAACVAESNSSILPIKVKARSEEQALEAIFRIAFDYGIDSNGIHTAPDSVQPRWWTGVKVRLADTPPFYPWPAPAWNTLYEQEELAKYWNDVLTNIKPLLSSDGADDGDPRILDALASWFIAACHALDSRNSVRSELSLDDEGLIPQNRRGPRSERRHETRQHIIANWETQFTIFAAPESGISEKTAQALLNSKISANDWANYTLFVKEHGVKDFVTPGVVVVPDITSTHAVWKVAYTLRKKRLEDAGVPSEQVDSLLDEIDTKFKDHPWVKLFGRWSQVVRPI